MRAVARVGSSPGAAVASSRRWDRPDLVGATLPCMSFAATPPCVLRRTSQTHCLRWFIARVPFWEAFGRRQRKRREGMETANGTIQLGGDDGKLGETRQVCSNQTKCAAGSQARMVLVRNLERVLCLNGSQFIRSSIV